MNFLRSYWTRNRIQITFFFFYLKMELDSIFLTIFSKSGKIEAKPLKKKWANKDWNWKTRKSILKNEIHYIYLKTK